MIIQELDVRAFVLKKGFSKGRTVFGKLVERRNNYGAPEFDFDGATFYVEEMNIDYITNKEHVLQAVLVTSEGSEKYAGGRFVLEVDYNAKTMHLEQV